ncbi:MAG: Pentapeptide repeat protein [Candidatus Nomurabacteria bacterium GW2011_GWC2_35_8]|uniref:Pentapeptide repeat protein n=1 Tax=Candidatus Nomurabacteria bacterium GW2011_GWC2_35_8 TaxID=1618752 RepID=A0A0G0D2Y0_9BACT|nr:MAG: Pentapeptide repeat protein [Candidatus Nomurabacteria bacterium GW2011_GWC2_35_8]
MLCGAYLENAWLWGAQLEGADLSHANLNGIRGSEINLERANLSYANLVMATLYGANLKNANLQNSCLNGSDLMKASLEEADFSMAQVEKVRFVKVHLERAKFRLSKVSSDTIFDRCFFDEETDFTGVGLDAALVEPRLKEALKNNTRRKQWQEWFSEGNKLQRLFKNSIVRLFWWLTDYGSSMPRIIYTFIFISILFGGIYYTFEVQAIPGLKSIIHNLGAFSEDGNIITYSNSHIFARSMYFSIVTMTTLGFGDLHAATTGDLWGMIGYGFLSFQVILGYVLLGALITRLGILFSGEGPQLKSTSQRNEIGA